MPLAFTQEDFLVKVFFPHASRIQLKYDGISCRDGHAVYISLEFKENIYPVNDLKLTVFFFLFLLCFNHHLNVLNW